MFSQNSYVEVLTPNLMVLEPEALGKYLGHEGRALMNGISSLALFLPCEDMSLQPTCSLSAM